MTYFNPETKGRPITAFDEGISVGVNVGSFNFTGAGATATGVGADITVDVPGAGPGLQKETPTGAIDDSNLAYTVLNTPKFIVLNGQLQEEGGIDYTRVGLNITFNIAPPAGSILRSYY